MKDRTIFDTMTEEQNSPGDSQPESPPALRARVPDHVVDGVFSTGCIVMTGPNEFIVDFLQTIGRPQRVAKRVIIPHPVMPQFIEALNTNLDLYRNRFGDPPTPPQATNADPNARKPTPQEIYDDLKMPDEVMSGTYANGVMIGHGASEFGLDFLTSFFPQSAVSARVFLAAGQVPRLLDSLRNAIRQLQQRQQQSFPSPTDLNPEALPSDESWGSNESQPGDESDPDASDAGSSGPNPNDPPPGNRDD